jgi:hypothetical protein
LDHFRRIIVCEIKRRKSAAGVTIRYKSSAGFSGCGLDHLVRGGERATTPDKGQINVRDFKIDLLQ